VKKEREEKVESRQKTTNKKQKRKDKGRESKVESRQGKRAGPRRVWGARVEQGEGGRNGGLLRSLCFTMQST
jgi:hypothetical protein